MYFPFFSDPFSNKRNVARSLQNLRMFDYFYNCLRKTGLYFSLPTSHQNISNYYKCKRKTSHKAKERERQSKSKSTERSEISAAQTGSELKTASNKVLIDEKSRTIPIKETNKTVEQVSGCEIVDKEFQEVSKVDVSSESDLKNQTGTESDCSIKENQFFEDCKLGNVTFSSELESSYSKAETDNDKGHDDLDKFEELSLKDKMVFEEDKKIAKSKANVSICESCIREQSENVRTCEQSDVSECDSIKSSNQIAVQGVVDSPVSNVKRCPNCEILNADSVCGRLLEESDRQSATSSEIVTEVVDEVVASVVDICDKKIDECDNITDSVSENEQNLTDEEVDKITRKGNHVDKLSHANSELSSGSDMEAESPDSSPLLKRKILVSSPVGAEYEFKFDSDTFTDGKVNTCILVYLVIVFFCGGGDCPSL